MRTFTSGATRDSDENKYDYDGFLSPLTFQKYISYMDYERGLAWAGGLFEGEGCIYRTKQNPPNIRLAVRMTDREPLDRFLAIVGKGHINGPYETRQSAKGKTKINPKWKPNYIWGAHGQDAIDVVRLLFPYLSMRRLVKLSDILDTGRVYNPSILPSEVIAAFGAYMHSHRVQPDGSIRAAGNWKKGIPMDSYMSSMWRHLQDVWLHHEGHSDKAREPIEEALCAMMFNVQGMLHETVKKRQE